MFNRELQEEIKSMIKMINKLETQSERIEKTADFKNHLYSKFRDEVDELLSSINLQKDKNIE